MKKVKAYLRHWANRLHASRYGSTAADIAMYYLIPCAVAAATAAAVTLMLSRG